MRPALREGSRYRRFIDSRRARLSSGQLELWSRLAVRRALLARLLIWTYWFAAATAFFLVVLRRGTRPENTLFEDAFELVNLPLTSSLVSAVGLALLTSALIRRKRVALNFVLAFQIGGALLAIGDAIWAFVLPRPWHLIAIDFVSQVLAFGVSVLGIAAAWWLRPAFPAQLTRGSWLGGSAVLVGGTLVTVLASHLMLMATRTNSRTSDAEVLRAALARSLDISRISTPERIPLWIPDVTAVLFALTLILSTWVFLRSARRGGEWSETAEVTIRTLLAEHGQEDSLGYFATRRDREFILEPGNRAGVSYRVLGSVCVAAGDPIGDPQHWSEAIAGWLDYARTYGWVPGVISASERGARAYAEHDLQILNLGDEAILHSDTFAINSTTLTPVRKAAERVRRAGVTIEICRHADLDSERLREITDLTDAWRHGETERGFSMALNRLGDPADGRCLLVLACVEERPVGLLSFVPWGVRDLSLDVMRRSPEAPNGITEAMVAELMAQAEGLGVRRVSLNFAMLRQSFVEADRLGATQAQRLNSSLLGLMDKFLQLERLYRSNEKYRPEWVPRYVCFDGALTLPKLAVSASRLEGFGPTWLLPADRQAELSESGLAEIDRIKLHPGPAVPAPKRSPLSLIRLAHAERLSALGIPPYPVGLSAQRSVATLADWDGSPARIFGRVTRMRDHGGVAFAELRDGGHREQMVLERASCARMREFTDLIDVGDLVVVDARRGASRTGTPSLVVTSWEVAAKSLQPIPFDGWDDPNQRLRRRATDLLVHPESADLLRQRSRAFAAVRAELTGAGFAEVETPMLQTVHGGANARPFRTHINAYGVDLTLRIAPELALKKLLVAGLGPIFEIGRNFRNEGADSTHNPEFTSLEAYQPFADYTTMRLLTERLIKGAAIAVYGAEVLPLRMSEASRGTLRTVEWTGHLPEGYAMVDVSGGWPVVTVADAVSAAVGRQVGIATPIDELLELAREHEVAVHDGMGPGAVIEELYGELVEAATVIPTFYCDFPAETSPLTAPHRSSPGLTERWDLVANAMEIGTAYSELSDPLEQRRRLTEQSLKAAAGDVEAMQIDEDFLLALENGMPPAGGLGIGMDRLVMLLTATSIRDVLSFPFVKPLNRR